MEFQRISEKDLAKKVVIFFQEYTRPLSLLINNESTTEAPLANLMEEFLQQGTEEGDETSDKERGGRPKKHYLK